MLYAICRPRGGGTCQHDDSSNRTQCRSVCEARSQEECACGEPYECVVCCQDRSGPSTCGPVTVLNGSLPLSNGAPCSNNRVCVDVSQRDCVSTGLHVLRLILLYTLGSVHGHHSRCDRTFLQYHSQFGYQCIR